MKDPIDFSMVFAMEDPMALAMEDPMEFAMNVGWELR
jgi:hypothetical protein